MADIKPCDTMNDAYSKVNDPFPCHDFQDLPDYPDGLQLLTFGSHEISRDVRKMT